MNTNIGRFYQKYSGKNQRKEHVRMRIGVELEEGVRLLLERTQPIERVEELPLERTRGRILAEDVFSPMDLPPFDRSPLDGYAVRSADVAAATSEAPAKLRVIGTECAGDYFAGHVGAGEAVNIMTGAAIPAGCDCVIRQEDTDDGMPFVRIFHPARHHDNFCFQGEDVKKGTLLLRRGEKLSYVSIGVLASLGFTRTRVYTPPRILLLNTGSELIEPGEQAGPGQIYNANRYLLETRLQELGFSPKVLPACRDESASAARVIAEALPEADLVLTTGGVSVGKKDIMHEVLQLLGAETLFWRLLMKPGMPMLGAIADNKPLLCLSGNPFAALATFELLARPVLSRLARDESLVCRTGEGIMQSDFGKPSPKRRFIRAQCKNGFVDVSRGNHSSGAISSMLGCNVFIDIPAGSGGPRQGDRVRLVWL